MNANVNNQLSTKNECSKTKPVNEPYEVWRNEASGWEWRVLKKYQSPAKEATNPYSRWMCAVKSPMTYPRYDMGDVYVREELTNAVKVNNPVVDKW